MLNFDGMVANGVGLTICDAALKKTIVSQAIRLVIISEREQISRSAFTIHRDGRPRPRLIPSRLESFHCRPSIVRLRWDGPRRTEGKYLDRETCRWRTFVEKVAFILEWYSQSSDIVWHGVAQTAKGAAVNVTCSERGEHSRVWQRGVRQMVTIVLLSFICKLNKAKERESTVVVPRRTPVSLDVREAPILG